MGGDPLYGVVVSFVCSCFARSRRTYAGSCVPSLGNKLEKSRPGPGRGVIERDTGIQSLKEQHMAP
jgi:hypothetical protein